MILTDKSPMPFGKHRGTPMEKVPAKYLHWLWSKPDGLSGNTTTGVGKYIHDNLAALQKEHPDGIW